ncbi:hypothetical protein [Parvularcula maris]|uniref:VPLPA-CTERM sorting domain-containing protein n=1 Tax=Parvularcula maris TaxID=2965077 RepID=A0A9X2LBS5_9PROT|nr:hypothetical protein [Parvularcula maris]MCQ8186583.1 hypothetical protein [Parvularcula maris]
MRRLGLTTALVAAAGMGFASAATVTIDDFATPQTVTIGADMTMSEGVTGDAASLLGGVREVTLSNQDGLDLDLESIFNAQGAFGRFESGASANGTGIFTTFLLEYDGTNDGSFDTDGLGGIDLVDGTNTGFRVGANFVDGVSEITVTVWDGDSSASASFELTASGIFTLAFSEFAGIDFTQVDALSVTALNQTAAADFNLDFIETAPLSDIVVPVPGAALLFAGALGAYAAKRRKKGV